jgi:hypothetical protein
MPSTGLIDIALIVVPVIVGLVFVGIVAVAIINVRRARRAGHNPLTMQTDLASKALDSELLRPERSTEERLSALDRLHRAGSITAEEHAEARRRILSA